MFVHRPTTSALLPASRPLLLAALLAVSTAASAQTATDLAKTSQNPVSDLVSIPLQMNFNGGGDLEDQTHFNLNLQPVIPMRLTPRVGLIFRTIVPFHSFPGTAGQQNGGVGDIQAQLFLTPARPGRVIWGVGPMFSLPTSTAQPARTGTWAGGVSAVVLAMEGPWVLGSLFTQVSPMSDSGGAPETNVFSWQYFVNYNFGHGWTISTTPTIVANWDAPDGQQWTVPVGGGISRTLAFQGQPMTLGFSYFKNVVQPDGAAGTTARFIVSFLFPTKRP